MDIHVMIERKGYKFYVSTADTMIDGHAIEPFLQDNFTREALFDGSPEFMDVYSVLQQQNYNREIEIALDIDTLHSVINRPGYRDYVDTDAIIKAFRNKGIPRYHKDDALDKLEWVYILEGIGYNIFKIGMTKRSPQERIFDFSPKMPFDTGIYHSFWSLDALKEERSLHKRFSNRRTNGEWFELSDDDLEAIVDETAQRSLRYIGGAHE